jgi:hypothetical protein
MNRKSLLLALVSISLSIAAAFADSVVVSTVLGPSGMPLFPTRSVTTAESSASFEPAPVNGDVYQFKVTTDGDILSVNNISITLLGGATLYQHTAADIQDANKPQAGLEVLFPSITADTWIDTPGIGSRLGSALPGDGTTTIGDITNDGPQTDFIFAQLTLPRGAKGTFSGRISIASQQPGVVFDQVFGAMLIPEPSAAVLAAFGFPLVRRLHSRRLERRDGSLKRTPLNDFLHE